MSSERMSWIRVYICFLLSVAGLRSVTATAVGRVPTYTAGQCRSGNASLCVLVCSGESIVVFVNVREEARCESAFKEQ